MKQSINQSINRSINQSINQSVSKRLVPKNFPVLYELSKSSGQNLFNLQLAAMTKRQRSPASNASGSHISDTTLQLGEQSPLPSPVRELDANEFDLEYFGIGTIGSDFEA